MAKVQTKEEIEWEDKLYNKARDMGVPGCTGLAEYIIKLEERILNLEIALHIVEIPNERPKQKPKQKQK